MLAPRILPTGTIPVLLVDDHQLVIEGVQVLLRHAPDIHVVATANSGVQALQLLRQHPDILVVLVDLHMPQMSGQAFIQAAHATHPYLRVIVLSMYHDHATVRGVLAAGGAGYLLKDTTAQELSIAIRRVAGGRTFFSPAVGTTLLDNLDVPATRLPGNPAVPLTTREREVLQLIAGEHSNAAIAAKMGISERTVETHRKNIFTKTGAKSVVGLLQYALRYKLIAIP